MLKYFSHALSNLVFSLVCLFHAQASLKTLQKQFEFSCDIVFIGVSRDMMIKPYDSVLISTFNKLCDERLCTIYFINVD